MCCGAATAVLCELVRAPVWVQVALLHVVVKRVERGLSGAARVVGVYLGARLHGGPFIL